MAPETSDPRRWYAHTLEGHGPEHWQDLIVHLREVARMASDFAAAFGSSEWASLAGMLHDLGKYAEDFQDYLLSFRDDAEVLDASILDASARGPNHPRVDHSSAGAVRVYELCDGRIAQNGDMPSAEAALAMVIAGHHAGLPARQKDDGSFVDLRLKKAEKQARLDAARRNGKPEIDEPMGLKPPAIPAMFARQPIAYGKGQDAKKDEWCLRYEFWTRMLFSCLIDADRLNTEEFESLARAEERKASRAEDVGLQTLLDRLNQHLEGVAGKARGRLENLSAEARPGAEAVLGMRADVLADCRKAAEGDPGRYSLTVPTGGGKTLAALAFALRHAIKNDLRRVIVVIPFTSIIDQTVRVYEDAFRDLKRALIEHHSNIDPTRETVHNRLASENWDAPVVVTTSVQFFESLFADRGTAARKLHNIAGSVVVFDEVQSLPHGLREPIFDALNRLVDDYGVSILCCTATQPVLDMDTANRQAFPHLAGVREVVSDPCRLFEIVKPRVTADFSRATAPVSWEAIAAELKSDENRRSLAIVERRDDARDLWEQLKDQRPYPLSALMCAEHRRKILAEIAEAMRDPTRDCRVVSTTLIEAGVDLDFPVVYRVLGGVDALAQAAGRCNRSGALTDAQKRPIPGRLIVFLPPTDAPRGLDVGRKTTSGMLNDPSLERLDLFDPTTYRIYFKRYLMNRNVDERDVMRARKDRDFPEIARRFKMIDDQGQVAVIVPYGDAEKRVQSYRDYPCLTTLRALQPYVVNISQRQFCGLVKGGVIETINDQVHWVVRGPKQYDEHFGLIVDGVAAYDPKDLWCGE